MNKTIYPFGHKKEIRVLSGLVILCHFMYLIWEVYWASQVGYTFIKWHTHLMVLLYPMLLSLVLARVVQASRASKILLASAAIIFAVFITELFLSLTGNTRTYMEAMSGYYESPYASTDRGHYHVWAPSAYHQISKPEYSYSYPANSLGLPDREWQVSRMPQEKRILALGDSFTEGDGAPADSSYVSILGRLASASGESLYVMNAGVCGSDPCNNFVVLRDHLLVYKPDLVIQSVGSGDILGDILLRGGLERFRRDGTVRYRPAPCWEPLYAMSYTSRLFFRIAGYDELLRQRTMTSGEKTRIDQSIKELFTEYVALCQRHRIRCIVTLHPHRGEIESGRYDYDFGPLQRYLTDDLHVPVIDLLPRYRSYLDRTHTAPAQYYWPHDGHHNADGYYMMAQTTLSAIMPFIHDSLEVRK